MGKLTETSLNKWTGSYSMSFVMKKSFATAKRVISGMEKMSMNCFTFGPCDGEYIDMADTNFCLFTNYVVFVDVHKLLNGICFSVVFCMTV